MRGPTKKQLSLIELVDQGLSVDEIAMQTGKGMASVHKQLNRVRRKIREGHFLPAPLPIERAAATPRIYLAGFDVFRSDALSHGEFLKALCQARGAIGLYPLDGQVPCDLAPLAKAQWICRANLDAIRSADIVMANLNDFRGAGEPDSGTAFEVGFAAALGKPVWAYTHDDRTLIDRVSVKKDGAVAYCANGFVVEDFSLNLNLMLACSARVVVGGPETCLDAMLATCAI
jgi:nucleoside 2-deoxyribosyltransferase